MHAACCWHAFLLLMRTLHLSAGPPGPTAMAATASAAAASLGAAAAQLGLLPDGGQELSELLSKLQVWIGKFPYNTCYRQCKSHCLPGWNHHVQARCAATQAVNMSAACKCRVAAGKPAYYVTAAGHETSPGKVFHMGMCMLCHVMLACTDRLSRRSCQVCSALRLRGPAMRPSTGRPSTTWRRQGRGRVGPLKLNPKDRMCPHLHAAVHMHAPPWKDGEFSYSDVNPTPCLIPRTMHIYELQAGS
jgi:hypothetical protein